MSGNPVMKEYTIQLFGGDDGEAARIRSSSQDGLCTVRLDYRGKSIEASASDYFEALAGVRLKLEPENLIPICYGASLDVFPSGMCRDMSAGLMAYRLKPRKSPDTQDLVCIFETGPEVKPSSVAEQRKFFEKWLKK